MRKFKGLTSILLVDDDEATNFLHEFVIKKTNIKVVIEKVYNVKDGLDFLGRKGKFESITSYESPQIIFLDLNMPGLDGWNFLESYKSLNEELRQNIIIVILTTSLNPDDKLKSEQIKEVKSFLNKPLTPKNVIEIVEQYFEEEKP